MRYLTSVYLYYNNHYHVSRSLNSIVRELHHSNLLFLFTNQMHTFWLEEVNYSELTREMYATCFSLPSSIFYPRWRRLAAIDYVYTSEGGNMDCIDQNDVEHKVGIANLQASVMR